MTERTLLARAKRFVRAFTELVDDLTDLAKKLAALTPWVWFLVESLKLF